MKLRDNRFHDFYLGGLVLEGNDTTLNHFMVQVVSFTGSLSHTGEYGVTTMGLGDVVNQLHDKYGLSYSGTTEETYKPISYLADLKNWLWNP